MTLSVLHFHSGNMFGGVERALIDLAEADTACHHQVALCWNGETALRLAQVGTVHELRSVRLSRPWQIVAVRRMARRLLRDIGPDVTVTHSDWSTAVFGPVIRAMGIPLVRWHHSGPLHRGLDALARRVPVAEHVANSRWTAAQLRRPASVVYPPVRAPAVRATPADVRTALGTDPGQTIVLTVARMEAGKGHDVLLDALAAVDDPALRCWLVGGARTAGEREYVTTLEHRVAALRLGDRVRFLGVREDIGDLLAAADIYCQPSVTPESFGIAIVEALYCGCPAIATDAGGPTEILTDLCGVRVPPGDVTALAAAVATLHQDPVQRERLSRGGPTRAATLCAPAPQAAAFAALLQRAAGATLHPA